MGLGLWKLGWPGSQVAGIFPGILLLRGLGLAPGLDFFGLGCRWTSKIMDALVYEYILASGRESGHLEGICKKSVFSEFSSWGLQIFKLCWTWAILPCLQSGWTWSSLV